MNTFGNIFRLTTFGESHGAGIGGVIDGFPAGITIDMDFLQEELDRRRPGQSKLTTSRKESDSVEILSGVFERDVLLAFWCVTKISIPMIMIICVKFSALVMRTLPIIISMVCATIVEVDARRHAKPYPDVWVVLSRKWRCENWG